MGEGGEFAQLEVLIAGNLVGHAHRGKHFRLLNGIDAEVRFQIEIQI